MAEYVEMNPLIESPPAERGRALLGPPSVSIVATEEEELNRLSFAIRNGDLGRVWKFMDREGIEKFLKTALMFKMDQKLLLVNPLQLAVLNKQAQVIKKVIDCRTYYTVYISWLVLSVVGDPESRVLLILHCGPS